MLKAEANIRQLTDKFLTAVIDSKSTAYK